ncbi:MAG: hypothetical protein H6744_09775 [Deltaproteobacteria bacterium]|nr:hypothetical protein [Deltaproteobacteria bacterium]
MRSLHGIRRLGWCALLLGAVGAACGGGGGGGTDADAGDAGDALPDGRAFFLGARLEGYDITASRQRVFSVEAAGDPALSEVVVVPVDQLGLPWEAFKGPDNTPVELPAAWVAAVDAMKAAALATGKPMVLSLSPLAPTLDTLAPDARDESGLLVLNTQWTARCYDPSKDPDPERYRDRYAGFVAWVVQRFDPRWVVLARRVNRYEVCGRSAYDAVLGFASEAGRRLDALPAGAVSAETLVTVDVEDLYGYPRPGGPCDTLGAAACLATRQGLLDGIDADLLGLESYPATALPSLGQLPQDWLERVAAARADLPSAVAGTSLPAVDLYTREGTCQPLLVSSDVVQRAWLDQVLSTAADREMAFVVWHPLQDLLDADAASACPCSPADPVCVHLDQLGAGASDVRRFVTGGLFEHDGTERIGGTLWKGLLAP